MKSSTQMPAATPNYRRRLYFALKQLNVVLTVSWGLTFTMSTIRSVGPETFSFLVVLNSIGIALAFIDLGISKIVFVEIRYHHSEPYFDGRFASGIVLIFFSCIAASTLVLTGILLVVGLPAADILYAIVFFPSCAFGLVWNLINNVAVARGVHVSVEGAYVSMRMVHVVSISALLLGLPLFLSLLLIFASWILTLSYAMWRTHLFFKWTEAVAVWGLGKEFLRRRSGLVGHSVAFMAAELAIYQFPMIYVPAVYGFGWPVVAVDTFYKVHRAGSAFFRAVAESRTPDLVDAYRDSDLRRVRKHLFVTGVICLLGAVLGSSALLAGGKAVFALIAGPENAIPPALVYVISVFFIFSAIENTATNFLLNTGNIAPLRDADLTTVAMLLVGSVFLYYGRAGELIFLSVYTACYAVMVALKVRSSSVRVVDSAMGGPSPSAS